MTDEHFPVPEGHIGLLEARQVLEEAVWPASVDAVIEYPSHIRDRREQHYDGLWQKARSAQAHLVQRRTVISNLLIDKLGDEKSGLSAYAGISLSQMSEVPTGYWALDEAHDAVEAGIIILHPQARMLFPTWVALQNQPISFKRPKFEEWLKRYQRQGVKLDQANCTKWLTQYFVSTDRGSAEYDTRAKLFEEAKRRYPSVSENRFYKAIWPDALRDASAKESGAKEWGNPGRRPKKQN